MPTKNQIIIAVLLVLSVTLIAGCTNQNQTTNNQTTVKTGDNITVDYIGTLDNGSVFDTSIVPIAQQYNLTYPEYRTPISFVAGSGTLIPGFENATIGMKAGETKNITISPENAYGQYNQSLIIPVNMSELTHSNITPYVNETLSTAYGDTVRVDSIPNNTTVMIDFNSPLAGKTLHFSIKVLNITPESATLTPMSTTNG
ncbi:MAG TPA: peptidylprolyl isomerase [Methanocella sp.]|nr:peptidylprolyl isomerase [Methanocella sp.]